MCVSQGSAASDAGRLTQRIGRLAVLAGQAAHPVGKLVRGACAGRGPGDHLPDVLAQLYAFDILRQVIKPADQAERVAENRESRLPEAGGYTEPGLLSEFDHDPIVHLFDGDRDRGPAAGARSRVRSYLDSHFITFAQHLGVHAAVVELSQKSMCDVGW